MVELTEWVNSYHPIIHSAASVWEHYYWLHKDAAEGPMFCVSETCLVLPVNDASFTDRSVRYVPSGWGNLVVAAVRLGVIHVKMQMGDEVNGTLPQPVGITQDEKVPLIPYREIVGAA
jgi:hypothetical protein